MTVQDLILVLFGLDPALRVVMPSETGPEFCEVDTAFLDLVRFVDGGAELTDEQDCDHASVVRLFGPDL